MRGDRSVQRHLPRMEAIAAPWCRSVPDVLSELKVDSARGLTEDEAKARAAKYGYNELAKEPPTPLWKLIAEQFEDTLVQVRHVRQAAAKAAKVL